MCEVRDLKPNGANILVTEENKKEYVHLVCQMKMTGETDCSLPSNVHLLFVDRRLQPVHTHTSDEPLQKPSVNPPAVLQVPSANSWGPSWRASTRSSPRG